MMISKAKIKYLRSLEQKKVRKAEGLFVAEGTKSVTDIMKVVTPRTIVATEAFLSCHTNLPASCEVLEATEEELKRISFLQTPQQVFAVFPQPQGAQPAIDRENLYLALDGIQDPGNLGTIIRIADWFGITQIFCSKDTAEVWNPKVIQATMGSIARVGVTYTDLTDFLDSLPKDTPVYGTFLDGEDISSTPLQNHGIIVMGNEGKGISEEIRQRVTQRILIPNYPHGRQPARSLTGARAAARPVLGGGGRGGGGGGTHLSLYDTIEKVCASSLWSVIYKAGVVVGCL